MVISIVFLAGCGGEQSAPEALIAYASKSELYLTHPDGTQTRLLLRPDHSELATNPGEPAWSPDGRRLAFSAAPSDGFSDIWVVDVDGTDLRNLTRGLMRVGDGASSDELAPAWSSDGSKIAFGSDRCASQSCIFVMNDDGTDVQQLTRGPDDQAPSWSPDGRWIAFSRSNDIYLVDTDGTGERRLTRGSNDCPSRKSDPAWSPDGTLIAYVSETPTADRRKPFCGADTDGSGDWVYWGVLRVIGPDGARGRLVFPDGPLFPVKQPSVLGSPSWSPEGDRLVFEGSTRAGCAELHIVDTESGASSKLTRCGLDAGFDDPAWGPR